MKKMLLPRVTKTAVGSKLGNNGKVPREQMSSHVNSRTRRQQSAAVTTADIADNDNNTDLELDTEPADPNAAARTADPKAVLDARDAPPAAH